jgi:hypothetical protein
MLGRYFADKEPESDEPNVVWETYYLYGPDAQWLAKPEPVIATGTTVMDEFKELKSSIVPLLNRLSITPAPGSETDGPSEL